MDAWTSAPASPRLGPGDVHVWLADVDQAPGALPALGATLSADEHARAARFHFERDRQRFICARGALRDVLARYLGTPAAALRFEYGEHGKPLLPAIAAGELRFNVSHSGSLALVAVARGREIGVDIEATRPMDDRYAIASRFFSPREVATLQSLPARDRNDAFFACWTRKEAYLKALGDGLAHRLDSFDVTFAPGEQPRVSVLNDPDEAARWSVVALPAPAGYAAALVVEGGVDGVRFWRWAATPSLPPESDGRTSAL